MVWGKQRSASSPSRLYCPSFLVSVLNFATSPNSGVKLLGGFLRSEKTLDGVVLCVDRHSGYVVAVPARKKGLLAKEVAVMMIRHWLTVFDNPPHHLQ